MKKTLECLAAVLVFGMLAGCDGRHSAAGFRLPENGSVERGKAAFVELQCTRCDTVAGVDLPSPARVGFEVPLGGEVYQARTDGYLVTSIIHPSYRLAAGAAERQTPSGRGAAGGQEHAEPAGAVDRQAEPLQKDFLSTRSAR